jgi:hypothetical protein
MTKRQGFFLADSPVLITRKYLRSFSSGIQHRLFGIPSGTAKAKTQARARRIIIPTRLVNIAPNAQAKAKRRS